MDENRLLNYNAFDGSKGIPNVDDIVRIVLEEQKHSLSEEDRKILQDRENLRNELHSLQNADPSYSKEIDVSPFVFESGDVEPSSSCKSDVYFVDVEAIEHPSATTLENVEPCNAELDNTIANFIQDENVKTEVLRLNEQIGLNSASIRELSGDAKTLMLGKLKLKRKLANIERKIASFSSEEVRVNRIKRKKGTDSADTGHQKRTYFYRFGAPYFKSKERFPVDRNPDLLEIIQTDQPMNIRLPRAKRFLLHDAAFLEKNILKQLKTKRVEKLRKCLKQAEDRLEKERDNKALADDIHCIVRTIKETEEVTHISATKDWNIPIDFMVLSQSSRFTGEDYERIWRLTGSPTLSRAKFSENEYTELKSLAEKYNRQDWDRIASEMSTNRSGFMCFTKYVATVKRGKNKPWTKEENELLYNLCISMDYVSKSDSRYQFWKSVRRYFPDRTYTQVHSHWSYVLEPRIKKGRFSLEENKLMLKLFNDGKSYKEIAQVLQNRTCVQVRAHFEARLQSEINRGNWTPEEEEKLLQLVEKYGTHNWVTISKEMGTRNRSQCRLKYGLFIKNNQRFTLGTRAPKDFWTEEENEQFIDLLRRYGTDFTKMSQEMRTKTRKQLRHKYHRTKSKAEFQEVMFPLEESKREKSIWTDDEVEQFKQLLMEYGTQYKQISSLMPGKSPLQLRYKYYNMKNEWNLSLPSINKSNGVINESTKKSEYKKSTSALSTSLPIPVTHITAFPGVEKNQLLPEELFENLKPVFGTNDFSATCPETSDEPLASPSDPLFISSQETNILADSSPRTLEHDTPMLKPSKIPSKGHWTREEVEQFKQLFMVYGTDYKTISSIMQTKLPKQLRWKFYNLKNKCELSIFPATEGEKSFDHSSAIISEASVVPSATNILSEPVPMGDKTTYSLNSSQYKMPMLKSNFAKAIWTDADVEKFKGLLMEHGRQYKKINRMMPEKTLGQLRYKYDSMIKAGLIASVDKFEDSATKPKFKKGKKAPIPAPLIFHTELTSDQPLPFELYENIATISGGQPKSIQPRFATSEEHSLMISSPRSLSTVVDSNDGFTGFPDEGRHSPLSYRELRRVETTDHMESHGSSCEQMIVPEMMSEMHQESNELSDVILRGESVYKHTELVVESYSYEVVEVKHELVSYEMKEEDRRNEFSA